MKGVEEQTLLQGGEGVDILNIFHLHAYNPLKLLTISIAL
jgi:hypothetical protein